MSTEAPTHRHFPSRIAELGFCVALPASWQPQALPDETPEFDDPRRMFGLGVAVAPYAALVFAAGARPAFDEGTVMDWARWLMQEHGQALRAFGPGTLGTLPAMLGQCSAASDMGEMLTHFAFAEDGGRLLQVSITGPAALEATLWPAWQAVLESFALDSPRGPTVALAPAAAPAEPPPGTDTTVADVGAFALPGGRATLEQDHPLQRRWLEQGVGFAPRLLACDEDHGRAWAASIALRASLALPLGWHALDDSRRLLLLHPEGTVQIHLERRAAPGGDLDALLDELERHTRAEHPAPQCLRLRSGPVWGLAVRDIQVDGETLEQLHLLMAVGEAEALRARITAPPEAMRWAADLGEALLHGVQPEGEDAADADPDPDLDAADGRPAWALQAEALEAQGRLDEAERVMQQGCNQLGVLMSIAEMHRRAMLRCAAAGDAAGAAQARERAEHWAWVYASGATSGGEGAALSRQRDAFIRSLPAL